jgi:hypothetical protein
MIVLKTLPTEQLKALLKNLQSQGRNEMAAEAERVLALRQQAFAARPSAPMPSFEFEPEAEVEAKVQEPVAAVHPRSRARTLARVVGAMAAGAVAALVLTVPASLIVSPGARIEAAPSRQALSNLQAPPPAAGDPRAAIALSVQGPVAPERPEPAPIPSAQTAESPPRVAERLLGNRAPTAAGLAAQTQSDDPPGFRCVRLNAADQTICEDASRAALGRPGRVIPALRTDARKSN